jgi:hypothetical protein
LTRLPSAVALGLVSAALIASANATSADIADDVTIRVRDYIQESSASRQLELTGTVASRAAGETVEVLAKECGPSHRYYRLVAAATTVAGGSWRILTNAAPNYVQSPINAYFRARWRGRLSEPALNQVPAVVTVRWRPRLRRADVGVSTWMSGLSLRGRPVELQRKLPGIDTWVRVRRARLARGAGYGWFATRFAVRTRGLTLRVLVPAQTGAPCFSVGVSQTWRS